jgi:probable HAF family extracellular repeat protein
MSGSSIPGASAVKASRALCVSLVLGLSSAGCTSEAPTAPTLEPVAPTATISYNVVRLGGLGGTTGEASDMVDGRIVGYAERADGRFHAFLWESGVMQDLGALPNPILTFSRAMAINSGKQVVGFSLESGVTGGGSAEHAFLWQNNTMLDLGTLGGRSSSALDINRNGLVVGHAQNSAGNERAVLWRNGVIRDLGTLGGVQSAALGVNASGVIVGRSETKVGRYKAFIWSNGSMRALGTLAGGFTQANAINAAGQIVGFGTTESGAIHAILWQDGKTIDLGVLPGDQQSDAADIDDLGRITGHSEQSPVVGARTRVFLWERGVLRNLGYTAGKPNRALGISPAGHLVGSSTESGNQVAVLWRRE